MQHDWWRMYLYILKIRSKKFDTWEMTLTIIVQTMTTVDCLIQLQVYFVPMICTHIFSSYALWSLIYDLKLVTNYLHYYEVCMAFACPYIQTHLGNTWSNVENFDKSFIFQNGLQNISFQCAIESYTGLTRSINGVQMP